MKFVGIDRHKTTISICVVNDKRDILERRRFDCAQPEASVAVEASRWLRVALPDA